MRFNPRKLLGFGGGLTTETTGLGPDWPSSAGDRERGKFRPSRHPRLTTVAVTMEDEEVTKDTNELLEEVIFEIRLLRQALALEGFAADI